MSEAIYYHSPHINRLIIQPLYDRPNHTNERNMPVSDGGEPIAGGEGL